MTTCACIITAYFSPTNTTKTVCETIAQELSRTLGIPHESRSFTLPGERTEPLVFPEGSLVILGMPVYAGRVPNFMLKYLAQTEGNGSMGVPIVVYGNRNYDDSLIELRDIMEKAHIHTVAGGAFIGEHSFSRTRQPGPQQGPQLRPGRSQHDFQRQIPHACAGQGQRSLSAVHGAAESRRFP